VVNGKRNIVVNKGIYTSTYDIYGCYIGEIPNHRLSRGNELLILTNRVTL